MMLESASFEIEYGYADLDFQDRCSVYHFVLERQHASSNSVLARIPSGFHRVRNISQRRQAASNEAVAGVEPP